MEIELIANVYGPLSDESKKYPHLLRIDNTLHLMDYNDLMKLRVLLDEFHKDTKVEKF